MSRATFKILFYLKRNAPKKNGLIPVMCRITVNGKIAQFSCKLDVEEKMWSVETGLPFSGNDKDLSRVDFEVDEAAGILRITPDYTIRRTNRRTNMVYPFYLHEGTELVGVMG